MAGFLLFRDPSVSGSKQEEQSGKHWKYPHEGRQKNMNRYQCEKKIGDLMMQIGKVYHEYNPDGKYLHISIVGDVITANNSIHDEKQLNLWRVIK